MHEFTVNGQHSVENAGKYPAESGSFPVFRPPNNRRPLEIESLHLKHHGKPHGGHASDAEVLDPSSTIQGREGSLSMPALNRYRSRNFSVFSRARRLAILTCFLS